MAFLKKKKNAITDTISMALSRQYNDKAMAHATVDELKRAQVSLNTSNVTKY